MDTLCSLKNWDTANNSKAVGVYVGTENNKFVMAPTYNSSGAIWGDTGLVISGIVTSEGVTEAQKDYAGELNTDKIIAQLGIDVAQAAKYCRNYTFKNGKKGYLWSAGEAMDACANQEAINVAMDKIGSIYMAQNYWTSTQANASKAWKCDAYNFKIFQDYKYNEIAVIAVCSI